MADDLAKWRAALGEVDQVNNAQEMNWFEGATKSFINSMGPGLIGIKPAPEVQKWQAQHPLSTLGADLLGMAVPYGGWGKLATRVPKLGEAIRGLETSEKMLTNPYRTAAAVEALRWTPFEAGRVGLSAAFGDPGSWKDTLGEAMINVPLAAGAGILLKGLSGAVRDSSYARRMNQISEMFPEFNKDGPPQLQLRQLIQIRANRLAKIGDAGAATDTLMPVLDSLIGKNKIIIRAEVAQRMQGDKVLGNYLKPLENGDRQELNRLFYRTAGPGADTNSRLLGEFKDVDAVLKDFKVATDYPESYMQFPRVRAFNSDSAGQRTLSTVRKNMTPAGDNIWLAKEQDGLYMMALRAKGETRSGDRWMIFKTDSPAVFSPGAARWNDAVASMNAWLPARMSPKLLDEASKLNIYGGQQKFMQLFPEQFVKQLPQGNVERLAESLARRFGYKGDLKAAGAPFAEIRDLAKSKLAPSLFQFSKSPLGRYVTAVARNTYDHANTLSSKLYWGDIKAPGQSLFSYLTKAPTREGGLHEFFDKLTDTDVEMVRRAWLNQMTPEEAMTHGASDNVVSFLKELNKVDDWMLNELKNTAQITGGQSVTPLKNHMMISRTWRGDYRLPLYNTKGDLVHMASGLRPKDALNEAKAAVKGAAEKGETLVMKDPKPFLADRMDDLKWARQLKFTDPASKVAANLSAGKPFTFNERTGVKGFAGEQSWTKKELFDNIKKHLFTYNNYMAETSVYHGLSNELERLLHSDPTTYRQVVERLRDMAGKAGPIGKLTNYVTDKILEPVFPLGKNSATKIVQVANTAQVNLQLGMGNLAFPVVNALTFMQTVMPQVAFVLKSAPEAVARYYTWMPLEGTKTQTGVGVLDMLKLMKESLSRMAKPSEELQSMFLRASEEGVVDPRFAEEYVGEGIRRLSPKALASGEVGWIDYIKNISEFPIGVTEKFGRGHSFVVGTQTGELLGLQGDRLYQFAKDFVRNTMYSYTVADRAKILSGPIGSMFGLFKNWQMHYVGQMAGYFDQGFNYNNWAPLLWQSIGTFGVAGLGGMPLYGAADVASKWMTDKSLMLNMYNAFGGGDDNNTLLDDGIFYGLPGFLKLSLQGSTAAPLSDATRDFSMFFSFAVADRAKALQNAVGDAIDTWNLTGRHPFDNPQVRDEFIRALGPKSLYRTMQVIEDESLRSLTTGYPITKNLDMWQRFMYATGFTPVEVDRAYRASDELWRDQNERTKMVQALGEQYYRAQTQHDRVTQQYLLNRAVALGLSSSSVLKSASAHYAKYQRDVFERSFGNKEVRPYVQAGIIGGM